ncbi:magnesium transporter [Parvularcula lutaonensis]|uniref:Magnesium transporter MgtE n=1 Tax=Parvularcula lutaonensis TaxID=491923 RepID=A0ABV7M9P3_9PROT|nr:magnesium transporter [Parvularcula lutaonensis]GGY43018.1 magnesium transporter MgtE [Parvularcula lutaonensis]
MSETTTPEPLREDLPPETIEPEEEQETVLDERGSLTSDFVRMIRERIDEGDAEEVRRIVAELKPADIADLIEQLDEEDARKFVAIEGTELPFEVLPELEDGSRDIVVDALSTEQLAEAVSELDTDEAAFVLEDLDEKERAEVLAEMPIADRLALKAALDYDEDTAGRIMQRDVFAAPGYWNVGQILDRLRSVERLPDRFYDVYVVDPSYRIIGSVPLSKFIKAKRDTVIQDLCTPDPIVIDANMDQEEVAYLFEKYNLISAPVVDESKRLVGMITVDDIVEVVREEADEDMLALAGIAEDNSINAPVIKVARSRFVWLLVNLGTAILASFVIGLFDATIEQMVALAILMPIVASMGGNAGTQSMTVAVRNLSTRTLTTATALRAVYKETAVSIINGVAFAILMGAATAVWYGLLAGQPRSEAVALGGVLAASMIINMLCAGLAGILIPLGLSRIGQDPAVSSAVFVTTVTDVVGFFVFLGLAAVFLVG